MLEKARERQKAQIQALINYNLNKQLLKKENKERESLLYKSTDNRIPFLNGKIKIIKSCN